MTLKSPRIVSIENPGASIADAMSNLRIWLDDNKIEPVEFRMISPDAAGFTFEIQFRSEDEALLFESKFPSGDRADAIFQ
jgi:hypothetical protein